MKAARDSSRDDLWIAVTSLTSLVVAMLMEHPKREKVLDVYRGGIDALVESAGADPKQRSLALGMKAHADAIIQGLESPSDTT